MLLLLLSFPLGIFAQKTAVTEAEARAVASSWLKTMDKEQDYKVKDILTNLDYKIGEGLTFYVVRYDNPAFVIVPATKLVRPILAYSTKGGAGNSFKEGETHGAFYLLSSYNRAIEIHKSTETYMETAQNEWNGRSVACTGANSNYGGAALLEHYHTSRWMGRSEIFNCMTEFNNWTTYNRPRGYNTCVPNALSQIIKYYRHPYQGSTIIPAYVSNAAINHQTHIYDYEIMPFKSGSWGTTGGFGINPNPAGPNGPFALFYPYCGDGTITNRDDAPTMSQMGQLFFNAGSAAQMRWFYGSLNASGNWATGIANSFDYNFHSAHSICTQQTFHYIVLGNTVLSDSGFKGKIRRSIMKERPVLFAGFTRTSGGGHAFLLDGFQCDDFFHASLGFSGEYDGYYYLFTADSTGTYNKLSYQYGQSAAVELHPNCNLVPDITINNKTYTSQELEQAQNNITASNTTVQTGAKTFMIGGNSVELTSNVEVVLGAELFINIETCGVPKQGN